MLRLLICFSVVFFITLSEYGVMPYEATFIFNYFS
jgi:hypothetical protein